MSKTTMGNKLPRKLEQKMKTVGEQIRLARLRRDLSVAQVAERATCSPMTVARIEKGAPTVAIGIYLRVLYQKDEMGRALQDLALKHRERTKQREPSSSLEWPSRDGRGLRQRASKKQQTNR